MQVDTHSGKLEGERQGAHAVFRGIPFARPPVGPLRFCAPQPVAPWHGVRKALEFGPSAMQGKSSMPGLSASGPLSEDCLYLNVYTPAADAGKRPVMVFIHGGAFIMGSAASPVYDGGPLAERGDVVVVTLNYRLGALGYLSLVDQGGAAWGATANAGQLDQVAALRWVQDNIAAFGGDPGNVTIFGESAGAFACSMLMAMPTAKGLFHKVICQSGAAYDLFTAPDAKRFAGSFLERCGLAQGQASALRELPAERILEAQRKTPQPFGSRAFFPICDGTVLPDQLPTMFAAGASADVPLLIGSNRDELHFFNVDRLHQLDEPIADEELYRLLRAHFGEPISPSVPEVVTAYREARAGRGEPTAGRHLILAMQSDRHFRVPSTRLAEAKASHPAPARMYLFTHCSPAKRGALGACHALELAFVFGTLDAPFQDRFAGKGPEVEALSELMMDTWLAFARTGDPRHPGLPEWPVYEPTRRATMIFGRPGGLQDAPLEPERAAWDALM